MLESTNEFTNVTNLGAEAIGEPGKRSFRLLVDSGSNSASIWLEKEQLFQLAVAIRRLLAAVPERPDAPGLPPLEGEASSLTRLDFKVGKLALGLDERTGLLFIDAHEEDEEEERASPPRVRVWARRTQLAELAESAFKVCAAGRPLCPFCTRPIDPTGHFCPRVNGHHRGSGE